MIYFHPFKILFYALHDGFGIVGAVAPVALTKPFEWVNITFTAVATLTRGHDIGDSVRATIYYWREMLLMQSAFIALKLSAVYAFVTEILKTDIPLCDSKIRGKTTLSRTSPLIVLSNLVGVSFSPLFVTLFSASQIIFAPSLGRIPMFLWIAGVFIPRLLSHFINMALIVISSIRPVFLPMFVMISCCASDMFFWITAIAFSAILISALFASGFKTLVWIPTINMKEFSSCRMFRFTHSTALRLHRLFLWPPRLHGLLKAAQINLFSFILRKPDTLKTRSAITSTVMMIKLTIRNYHQNVVRQFGETRRVKLEPILLNMANRRADHTGESVDVLVKNFAFSVGEQIRSRFFLQAGVNPHSSQIKNLPRGRQSVVSKQIALLMVLQLLEYNQTPQASVRSKRLIVNRKAVSKGKGNSYRPAVKIMILFDMLSQFTRIVADNTKHGNILSLRPKSSWGFELGNSIVRWLITPSLALPYYTTKGA